MGQAAVATTEGAPQSPGEPAFFELSRLMVVAIDASTSKLNYIAQTAPNGAWETSWSPVDSTNTYSTSATGLTRDGRVAVVAQGVGGPVLYIDEAQDQSGGVEKWNNPYALGSPPGVGPMVSLSMARDGDGRIEIFGTASNGTVWWLYQNPDQLVTRQVTVTPPGTTTPIVVDVQELAPPATPWSGWQQLSGQLATITACRQGDGRIALIGINSGNHLYRCVQATAQAFKPSDWTGWVQLDTPPTGTFTLAAPIVGPLGALNIFALNQYGQILHTAQRPAASDTWTPWLLLGYSRTGFTALAAGLDGDGHLLLAGTDTAKVHSFNSQVDPNAMAWTGWRDFSATDWPPQLALDYNADGRLSLFSHWLLPSSVGVGGLWLISQAAIDSTEWEYNWTQLAPSNIRQFSVVRDLTPPA